MPKAFIGRHAPTNHNISGLIMGQLDEECIDKSLWRYDLAFASKKKFDVCYSSPLKRAVTTSDVLFPSLEKKFDNRLVERDYGCLEGMNKSDIETGNLCGYNEKRYLCPFYNPPKGESCIVFIKRIISFLYDLRGYSDNSNIIIMSHSGVIKIIDSLYNNRLLQHIFSNPKGHLEFEEFVLTSSKVDQMCQFAKQEYISKLEKIDCEFISEG